MSRKPRSIGVKFPLSNIDKGEANVNNNSYHDSYEAYKRNTYNRVLFSNGFQPQNFRFPFFWILPPVRSYRRVMEAILKLSKLNNLETDNRSEVSKFSVLKSDDRGFKELVKLLREDLLLSGKVDELSVIEGQVGVRIGPSPDVFRSLVSVTNGEISEVIMYQPFDPRAPIRELKEMAEKNLRKGLSFAVIVFFVIWVLLSLIIDLPSWG